MLKKGCIAIIARMGSKRLNNKHLLKINNEPIIGFLLKRLNFEFKKEISNGLLNIFICTGSEDKNKDFRKISKDYNSCIYFGEDDNIPRRMHNLLIKKKLDFVLAIDGDDILCSTEGARLVINKLQQNVHYSKTINFPFGMNSIGFSEQFIGKSLEKIKHKKLETGWGWIFDEKQCDFVSGDFQNDERLRFTLDYEQDFIFFKKIILNLKNIK